VSLARDLAVEALLQWAGKIGVGAGLGGDQFRPQAIVDVAGNVYVAFFDTTDGQKVVFSRFNEQAFDPPLAPSSVAGIAGCRRRRAHARHGSLRGRCTSLGRSTEAAHRRDDGLSLRSICS